MEFCNCSTCICFVVRYFVSITSFVFITIGKRELVALLCLSSWCLVIVVCLGFLAVQRGCLQFVIVVFPDHAHLLFLPLLTHIFESMNMFWNTKFRFSTQNKYGRLM